VVKIKGSILQGVGLSTIGRWERSYPPVLTGLSKTGEKKQKVEKIQKKNSGKGSDHDD